MDLFLTGLVFGFSIAAPVGPIGLLCIRRTLAEGRMAGFVSGLGAATADTFYGFIAAFGFSAISSLLLNYQLPIQILGAIFLFYLALKIFFTKPEEKIAQGEVNTSLLKSYTSTMFLTLTNPATILAFIAVFAALGVGTSGNNYIEASLIVLGVFLGSAIWWLVLSMAIGFMRHRISPNRMVWINRVSGILIAVLGVLPFLN